MKSVYSKGIFVLALLCASVVGAPTVGALSSDDAESKRLAAAQVPLLETADTIDAFVSQHALSGQASTTIDVPSRTVHVYWKGTLPVSLAAEIDRLDDTTKIKVHAARYSRAELHQQMAAITSDTNPLLIPPGDNHGRNSRPSSARCGTAQSADLHRDCLI